MVCTNHNMEYLSIQFVTGLTMRTIGHLAVSLEDGEKKIGEDWGGP